MAVQFRIDGKEKRLSLGVYPDVSLLQARKARDDARRQVLEGLRTLRQSAKRERASAVAADNSFETVARAWHASSGRALGRRSAPTRCCAASSWTPSRKLARCRFPTFVRRGYVAMAKKVKNRGRA